LLTDPFNGVADIEAKILRILHNYAFYEDPSRLIRATRLSARFHWTLEERTQARYDAAKENNYIENVADRPLGHEIEQLAHEENPLEVLKALEKESWLKVLVPHFSMAKVDTAGLTQLFKIKQQIQEIGLNPDASPIVMYFLTRKLGDKEVSGIQKQIPNKGFVERWRNLEDDAKDFSKQLNAKDLAIPSHAWKFLMQSRPETLLFTAITARAGAVEQRIKNFLTKWPLTRQKLQFPEMAEMRITPELPEYKKIQDEAFLLLLDGKLRNHTEIVKFLEPYKPPEPPPPPAPIRRGRAAKKEAPATEGAVPKKRGRKPKSATVAAAIPAGGAPAPAGSPVPDGPVAAVAKPAKPEGAKAPAKGEAARPEATKPPAKTAVKAKQEPKAKQGPAKAVHKQPAAKKPAKATKPKAKPAKKKPTPAKKTGKKK
jgi:tRNA nucleotidyltransferase/poly(A) polymerase